MKYPVHKFVAVVLLSLLAVLQGCTSMSALDMTEDRQKIVEQIQPGDEIDVTLKDGDKFRMKVVAVNTTTLSGENKTVALDDVTQIRKKEVDGKKTGLLIGGVSVYIYLAGLFLAGVMSSMLF